MAKNTMPAQVATLYGDDTDTVRFTTPARAALDASTDALRAARPQQPRLVIDGEPGTEADWAMIAHTRGWCHDMSVCAICCR